MEERRAKKGRACAHCMLKGFVQVTPKRPQQVGQLCASERTHPRASSTRRKPRPLLQGLTCTQ
eukprot:12772285-Alexandrium_andersonii.AAC.1